MLEVKFYKLTLVLILFLSAFLRLYNLGEIPEKGETLDEYAWVMVGEGLYKNGVPKSWSFFDYPSKSYESIEGFSVSVAEPAFDHPPLFGLYAALSQVFYNGPSDYAPLDILRIPMVILGVFNVLLFYFVLKKYAKTPFALLGTAFYATSPTVVVSSRLIISENMLITFLLMSLLVLDSKLTRTRKYLLIAVLCLIAPLVKVTGIFIAVSIFIYGFIVKDRKMVVSSVLGCTIGVLAFVLYGAYYDLVQFLIVQFQQSANRNQGLATFFITHFFRPEIVNTVFLDPSFLLAFVSFLVLVFNKVSKKHISMIVFATTYIFILIFTAGESTGVYNHQYTGGSLYGWYMYPLLPIYFVSMGILLQKSYLSKSVTSIFMFCLFMLGQLRNVMFMFGGYTSHFILNRGIVRGGYLIVAILTFISKYYYTIAFTITIIIFVTLNILTVIGFDLDYYYMNSSYLTGYN